MPVSDRIKFFDESKSLFADGATAVASSGQDVINRALDKNAVTKWRSVGSADTTTESITVTLSASSTINRVLILDHNWKSFTIKYDVAGAPTDFTNVSGLDGSLGGGITESAFADDTAYYEFDSVTTNKIYIEVTTTQVVDAEKFCSQIVVTSELGTLSGYPRISGLNISRNQKVKKTLSGKSLVVKSEEAARFRLDFRDYPSRSVYHADLDLMMSLFDREDNFLVWLSGGGRQGTKFNYALRGFRLKDLLEMQIDRDFRMSYTKNVYTLPVNIKVSLVEAI